MATSNWIKVCCFCGMETKNRRHESICKENPNPQKCLNAYTKARLNGEEYQVSDETREKLRISNIGRKHSPETIEKLRTVMAKAVENNPDSYSGRYNRGNVKEIICSNGYKVLGSWESAFVEYCIMNQISIEQPKVSFDYHYDRTRQYFPDFYLNEYDCYVEVKGFKTDKDITKWNSMVSNNHKLMIIDKRTISKIKDNSINLEILMQNYMVQPQGLAP
jgi:hypothetical protein